MQLAMKRQTFAFALLVGLAAPGWAAESAPLSTLGAVHALTNAEAAHGLHVAFEATVTYFRADQAALFVQDGDAAIYVMTGVSLKLQPGDRVLVKGITQSSYKPIVFSNDITMLRHGALPRPLPAGFPAMMQGSLDCMYVSVRGKVLFAAPDLRAGPHAATMELSIPGGEVGVTVDGGVDSALSRLEDAELEVRGVVSGRFDSKMQPTGVLIRAASFAQVGVVHAVETPANE